LFASAVEERIRSDYERADAQLGKTLEGRVEISFGTRTQNMDFEPDATRRRLHISR
jgi:hypothetical protein